jgi:hypothetical protein
VKLVFGESRIVVQKRQSLLAPAHFGHRHRGKNTTLLTGKSDISARKYLFLLRYAYASIQQKLTQFNMFLTAISGSAWLGDGGNWARPSKKNGGPETRTAVLDL